MLDSDEPTAPDVEDLEVIVPGQNVLQSIPGERVTLVQTDALQLGLVHHHLGPDQVVQAVHEQERELLQAGRELQQLPEYVRDYVGPVLVLESELLQLDVLVLTDGHQLTVMYDATQRESPQLRAVHSDEADVNMFEPVQGQAHKVRAADGQDR